MDSVVFAGPPPVRFTDSSYSCMLPLTVMIISRISVGLIRGIVIFVKICNRDAPSKMADS